MIHQVTAATTEPVTLSELKTALRIDTTDLDSELDAALSAARGEAENFAGRSFAPQRWQLTRDDWWLGGLLLPKGPVNDVVGIEYLDPDGTWQTLSPTAYDLQESFLFKDPMAEFPELLRRDNVVRIIFDAGDWDPPLPEAVKRSIVMLTQSKVDALADSPETLRERAVSLLRPYRHHVGFRAA